MIIGTIATIFVVGNVALLAVLKAASRADEAAAEFVIAE